jgi:hypothetical protein
VWTYKRQAILIFCLLDSHSGLRQDVVVRPRGRVGRAGAAARSRGEVPRVRVTLEIDQTCPRQLTFHLISVALRCVAPLPLLHRSGASATGCRHELDLGSRYLDLRQNPVLGEWPVFRAPHLARASCFDDVF